MQMQYEMVKFIAVGSPRSGSSWLHLALDSHPNIAMAGEVLDTPYFRTDPEFAKDIWKGIEDIWTPRSEKARGFKLFYTHCWDYMPEYKYVWERFKKDRSIKIVFLDRRNLLKMIVSWELAIKTNIWQVTRPLGERPRVFIDPSTIVEEISKAEAGLARAKNNFSEHELYHVSYEDLFADPSTHLGNIQRLLQVDPIVLQCDFLKMETRGLPDIVENYEEVRKTVADSDYAEFLD